MEIHTRQADKLDPIVTGRYGTTSTTHENSYGRAVPPTPHALGVRCNAVAPRPARIKGRDERLCRP